MEKVDFDQLCKNAYHAEATLQDKDNLWLEVFKLDEWHFIARGTSPEIHAYVAEAEILEPDSIWLYAFSSSNRATFYAKDHGLFQDDLENPILAIPNNQKIIDWVEKHKDYGVKGIFFNADGHGFFTTLRQINPIREHIHESYPDQF